MIEIRNLSGSVIYTEKDATTVRTAVIEAVKSRANLSSANLSFANLSSAKVKGAVINGRLIENLHVISYSSYPYQIQAILFQDGSRWVRMGCLFKSLEDWEKIGIRKSNIGSYPDDGSERSEVRAAAFEFAKAAAMRMKFPESEKQ
jgi:hypothetical protein